MIRHSICGSNEARRADAARVTPVLRRRIFIDTAPSRLISTCRSSSVKPKMSRYQRTDRSISDTNRITSIVVGAAVLQGPNCAAAG
jgi:hypothetical protein